MKCPECGGAPTDMVLMSNPPKYRCSKCGCIATGVAWMTGLLRGDEGAEKTHAEKLQAAREEAKEAEEFLYHLMNTEAHVASIVSAIARLIDAKVELALLERGS